MNKGLILLLTLLPLMTFSQSDSDGKKTRALGITFSPDYCYRILKPDAESKWIADLRDSMEMAKFGFTVGFNHIISLSDRVAVESSVYYSDKGEKTKEYPLTWIANQPDPALPSGVKYVYHYIYLDLPTKVNYYLAMKKVKLYLFIGISPNILLSEKATSTLIYDNGSSTSMTTKSNDGLAKINLAATAGLGVSVNLNDRFYLKAEPVYRRSITSIVDAPIKGYLYSMGMNIGCYFKL